MMLRCAQGLVTFAGELCLMSYVLSVLMSYVHAISYVYAMSYVSYVSAISYVLCLIKT